MKFLENPEPGVLAKAVLDTRSPTHQSDLGEFSSRIKALLQAFGTPHCVVARRTEGPLLTLEAIPAAPRPMSFEDTLPRLHQGASGPVAAPYAKSDTRPDAALYTKPDD